MPFFSRKGAKRHNISRSHGLPWECIHRSVICNETIDLLYDLCNDEELANAHRDLR